MLFSWDTYHGAFAAADFGPSRTIAADVVHYEYAIKGGLYELSPRRIDIRWWECNTLYRYVEDLPNIPDGLYVIYEGPVHPVVPEPGSVIVWSVFGALGMIVVVSRWRCRLH